MLADAPQLPTALRFETITLADGWRVRTAELDPSSEARGTLVFVGGRGDFIEKYAEALSDWAAAGWRVRTADWRGQGLSGRLGSDGTTGHADDFAPWVADLAALVRRWRDGGPLGLVGHSMGGHLVLRALVEGAVRADAAVLVAPMIGTRGPPAALARWMAAGLVRLGEPDRPAWRSQDKPGVGPGGRQGLLTHDNARYAEEVWWRTHHPELVVGPPSWSWLLAAYRSAAESFTAERLATVTTPVLILNALADRLVDPQATNAAAERLPDARLFDYGEAARHEILREVDAVRDHAMGLIDAFIGEQLAT